MEVSGNLQYLATLSWGRGRTFSPYPLNVRLDGPQTRFRIFEENKFLAPTKSRTKCFSIPTSNLFSMPISVFQLLMCLTQDTCARVEVNINPSVPV